MDRGAAWFTRTLALDQQAVLALLAAYAELVLATYCVPNPAQAQLQRSIVENAIHFMPVRRPCLHFTLCLDLVKTLDQARAHLRRRLSIANGSLEQEINQLADKEKQILSAMIKQQKRTDAPSVAPQ